MVNVFQFFNIQFHFYYVIWYIGTCLKYDLYVLSYILY